MRARRPKNIKQVPVPEDLAPVKILKKGRAFADVQEIPEGGTFIIRDTNGNVRSAPGYCDGFHYKVLPNDAEKGYAAGCAAAWLAKSYEEVGGLVMDGMADARFFRVPVEHYIEMRDRESARRKSISTGTAALHAETSRQTGGKASVTESISRAHAEIQVKERPGKGLAANKSGPGKRRGK